MATRDARRFGPARTEGEVHPPSRLDPSGSATHLALDANNVYWEENTLLDVATLHAKAR